MVLLTITPVFSQRTRRMPQQRRRQRTTRPLNNFLPSNTKHSLSLLIRVTIITMSVMLAQPALQSKLYGLKPPFSKHGVCLLWASFFPRPLCLHSRVLCWKCILVHLVNEFGRLLIPRRSYAQLDDGLNVWDKGLKSGISLYHRR